MSELTNMEVGKTYVFKDEESKGEWFECFPPNKIIYDECYDDGFNVLSINSLGNARVGTRQPITSDEFKYFKLKETDNMTLEDLKDMDLVTYRKGDTRLFIKNKFYEEDLEEIIRYKNSINQYNADLTSFFMTELDIMKVERGGKVIWERDTGKEDKKKEILENIETLKKQLEEL